MSGPGGVSAAFSLQQQPQSICSADKFRKSKFKRLAFDGGNEIRSFILYLAAPLKVLEKAASAFVTHTLIFENNPYSEIHVINRWPF